MSALGPLPKFAVNATPRRPSVIKQTCHSDRLLRGLRFCNQIQVSGYSRPLAILRLIRLHEKFGQLRNRISGRWRTCDVGDILVKPRYGLEHVAARRAVFEKMADLLHFGDPAIGLR